MMSVKVVVLHSGGLDSTVCLLQALRGGNEVLSVGVDYGQRHRIELEYASAQCRSRNVPRKVIKVEWDKPAREIPKDRLVEEMRSAVSSAFLPARNIVFLSLACAQAAGVGAAEVWIGVNAVDFSGYPDCRPEFVESFRRMLELGAPGGPKIVAPLLYMTKAEIVKEARRLGLQQGETWSCYEPVFSSEGIKPCGRCDACRLHDYGWSATR